MSGKPLTTIQKRRAAGLCPSCGGARESAAVKCFDCRAKRKEAGLTYQKEKCAGRKAAGLCIQCGHAAPGDGSVRCTTCATGRHKGNNAYAAGLRESRRSANKCVTCAITVTPGVERCEACRLKHNESERVTAASRYRERQLAGLCTQCSEPSGGKTLCVKCQAKRSPTKIAYYWRRKERRPHLCKICNEPVFHSSSKCKYHWIYSLVHNYTRGPVSNELIELMAKRLEDSNFTCAYTGEKLVSGENASIDHIYSRKLFPHLASDPQNMIWVDRTVNWLKQEIDPRDEKMLARLHPDIAARIRYYASTVDPTPPARPEEHPVA